MMRSLAAIAMAALAMAVPAAAEWPTTSFVPVPPGDDVQTIVGSGFSDYASDAGTLSAPGDALIADLPDLDLGALRRGAPAALIDLMRAVSIDAARMQAADFAAPRIEPLLRLQGGDSFYPIFWVAPASGYTFRAGGPCSARRIKDTAMVFIAANGVKFPYAKLDNAWRSGGARRETMIGYIGSQLTHEIVHTVQQNAFLANCGDGPPWILEGPADGIAYYLSAKRIPGLFDKIPALRNERRYDVSLDVRQFTGPDATQYGYNTGSFFRYLIEASRGGGSPDLAIMKDIVVMPSRIVGSRNAILAEIDRIIGTKSGGRNLYRVLPEFMTEYGSYGEGRYKKARGGGALDREDWIDKAFLHCVEFDIQPGQSLKKPISIQPMAGECVKVTWSNFTQPVALQLYAQGAGTDFGALHMGEAMRADGNGKRFCYGVTKGLARRIAEPMRKKCILKRETRVLSGAGSGGGEEAAWTSDFNLTGSGNVHFVITNIAKDPADTKPLSFQLLVGSLEAAQTGGAHVEPRQPGGAAQPVVGGMSDTHKRVHAMQGAGDRVLFDGRSIFGDGEGIGYLEGIPDATGPGGGPGVMTLVRGGDYWVGYVGARPGVSELSDGGLIIKDPARFESGNPMAGIIMSGGMAGMRSGGDCGYTIPAKFHLLEETPERLRFRVAGDLFDPMRAMTLGGAGSACDVMRATWVEFASFEVSLPNGALYAGDSAIERRRPPGQQVYDETEFLNGPNFGGIATSESLAAGTGPPPPDPDDDGQPGPGGGAGGGGGAAAFGSGACDCGCPDPDNPPRTECAAQCAPQWAMCRRTGPAPGPATAATSPEPAAPRPPTPTVEAQRKWFMRLVSGQGLAPEVEQMLADDFATMSDKTRAYLIRQYRHGVR